MAAAFLSHPTRPRLHLPTSICLMGLNTIWWFPPLYPRPNFSSEVHTCITNCLLDTSTWMSNRQTFHIQHPTLDPLSLFHFSKWQFYSSSYSHQKYIGVSFDSFPPTTASSSTFNLEKNTLKFIQHLTLTTNSPPLHLPALSHCHLSPRIL